MRRAFRLLGGFRLIVGAAIVITSFMLQSQLGEVWSGLLVLCGAMIAVSGLAGIIVLVAFNILLPVAFFSAKWLIFDSWNNSPLIYALQDELGTMKVFWIIGMFLVPLTVWELNQSWFFMVRKFSVDEKPSDTKYPELFASGAIQVTDSTYTGAVTITEQGLILDRRNFRPVILPWKWIKSVDPVESAASVHASANIRMRNDNDEFMTLVVPWNEALLRFDTARLKGDSA